MTPLWRHIFTISTGVMSWACVHDNSGYEALVAQWQGKEIILPPVMTDALTGDTIDLSVADFTILTYVDSTGCIGSRMKLPLWNEFFNSIDTITDAALPSDMILPKSYVDGVIKFRADSASGTFNNSVHIFYVGFDYPSVVQIYGRIL